ncbi:hypothetical protein H9Q10_08345 [Eikenella sp. S3360]|uniref:Uncharacterized protein n=1 Tax=Eikenella glucosivorans TaxID=2766967 RepID=A0ABS0NBM7_9NEIS|nr:hypothetical protein [Eikenella glucosivorans]MBH5329675.1 hypothetical protein [Eikenella glucosivorans]
MSQTLSITQISQSAGAKRTIANMAKAMRLDAGWLYTLLSLHWNYDKKGREAMGWVETKNDDARQEAYAEILSVFNLPETPVSPTEAAEAVLHVLHHTNEAALQQRFAAAAARGDFSVVQEFRTHHYHRNATAERLLKLWDKPLTPKYIADKLFYKVFSAYHACDPYVCLVLPMPYIQTDFEPTGWVDEFLGQVKAAHAEQPALGDLVKLIAPYCKGNKYFRQDVLVALSFAGLLPVVGHDVQNLYLPDCQQRYSPHFMSNEWAYPLRFWNSQQA